MTFCLFKQQKILTLGNETNPILDSLLLGGHDQQDDFTAWIWLRIIQDSDALVGGSG
jgi:hypothetical protein